jgi:transposase
MLADGLGRPLRFILTPGQTGDVTQAPALLKGCRADHVIADTAYDSRALRQLIASLGANAVIPTNPTRKHPFAHDPTIYKLRNRIERCFNKLKHFRRFATRYDKLAANYLAFIKLASIRLWLRTYESTP